MALGKTPALGVVDYIIFAITIAISAGIGVYYALTGGRQRTTSEFLVANRKLRVLPVALSLIVSYESSIMMLGNPAEVYLYGAEYWLINFGWGIAVFLGSQLLVPMFSQLKVLSGYEYLEHRFKSRAVRLLASFLGMLMNCWYMGAVLFGPATALEAVTGFPVWNSLFVVAAASVFYTTVGGIKAVIWADAFQCIIMLAGMLAVIIKGTMAVGGVTNVWKIAEEGGRLNVFNFSFDPTIRHTFWALVVGGGIRGLTLGTNQTTVQRIATMPTVRKAKIIVLLSIPGFLFFGTLAIAEGIIAYSYYRAIRCDPLEAKLIDNPNQLLPLFVMHVFDGLPGLPGLFLAALFSASLSTLSSGLSSLCTLMWTDFIKPHTRPVSEFKATLIAKGLVVLFGVISVGLALLVMNVEGPIGQISLSVTSAFAGPLVGMFLLGAFFYQATAKGALVGSIVSAALGLWMAMGSNFSSLHRKTPHLEPSSTDNCFASNISIIADYLDNVTAVSYNLDSGKYGLATAAAAIGQPRLSGLAALYSISYMWFGAIGIFSTVIIGLVVSFLTGPNKREDVDATYMVPFFDRLFCCLPEKILAKLRCGIDYDRIKSKDLQAVEKMIAAKDELMKGDAIFITDLIPNSETQSGYNAEPAESEARSGKKDSLEGSEVQSEYDDLLAESELQSGNHTENRPFQF